MTEKSTIQFVAIKIKLTNNRTQHNEFVCSSPLVPTFLAVLTMYALYTVS